MKFTGPVLCVAVGNRECEGLCVGLRGPGFEAVAPGGAKGGGSVLSGARVSFICTSVYFRNRSIDLKIPVRLEQY